MAFDLCPVSSTSFSRDSSFASRRPSVRRSPYFIIYCSDPSSSRLFFDLQTESILMCAGIRKHTHTYALVLICPLRDVLPRLPPAPLCVFVGHHRQNAINEALEFVFHSHLDLCDCIPPHGCSVFTRIFNSSSSFHFCLE